MITVNVAKLHKMVSTKKQKYNLDRSGDVGNINGVKLSRTSSQITNFKLLQIY